MRASGPGRAAAKTCVLAAACLLSAPATPAGGQTELGEGGAQERGADGEPGWEADGESDSEAEWDADWESDWEEDPAGDPGDPWQTFNRGIFAFNEFSDRYFIEPFAIGFDWAFPDVLQKGIDNVFDNGRLPIRFANNALQLKFGAAGNEIIRFLLNSGVGIGGLFDVASDTGLPPSREDFGQTLGFWGVPQGPFLMLPFLGPSNVRDGFGLCVDTATQFYSFFAPFYVNAALTVGNLVNIRALAIEVIRDNRASAFDLYVFTRNAYVSNRRAVVLDQDQSDAPAQPDEDFYYFDDSEEP